MLFAMMPKQFMPSLKDAKSKNTILGGYEASRWLTKAKYASAKLSSARGRTYETW